jgi:hypothetical protein
MSYLKYWLALANLILLLFPSVSFASSCEQIKAISEQINSDYSTSLAAVHQKLYPWQNISWLKEKLGEPNTSTFAETIYKWPNYSMLLRAGKPAEALGTGPIPGQVGVPSPEAVSQILGKPNSVENFPVSKYEWLCTETNQNARLTILTDSSNALFMIDSLYCTDLNGVNKKPACQGRSLNLGKSQAQTAM